MGGVFRVVDNDDVVLVCLDGRQKAQVVPQLSSGMWRGEVRKTAGQCYIVLWIEDM